jgi:acid stress-induced BolA-like protein IbaG/YrbA
VSPLVSLAVVWAAWPRSPAVALWTCSRPATSFGTDWQIIIMVTPDVVRGYIAAGLPCEHLEVDGDGRHFFAVIVSAAFEGKRPVQRHQVVYAVLGDRMREKSTPCP